MKNLEEKIKQQLKKMVNEGMEPETVNYMFFSNLKQMHRQCELLLNEFDPNMIDSILQDGHDWASDHIAEAKNNMDQVFDFLMNEKSKNQIQESEEELEEGKNKPTKPELWSRAKSLAKSKFKVYPSAYANGWASKWYKEHGGGWRKSKK